ncbi:TUG-UBL1 domain-containing protein [Aphelenchoides besseyi]|nr:TUG-UBL1 domain-containing protein [Aphelenchoides besseyi]KAI6200093.1 TUG-UBL1 domain-containing protein [Aphelenchoides besseyi]
MSNGTVNEFANFKFPDVPIATIGDLMASNSPSATDQPKPTDRMLLLFERQDVQVEDKIEDDFFELTVDDAKNLQRGLTEESRELNQQALMFRSTVEKRNTERKLKCYKNSVIRFRFQNTFLQSCFFSNEPSSRLFELICEVLNCSSKSFELLAGINEKLNCDETKDLISLGLAPKATIVVKLKELEFSRKIFDSKLVRESTSEKANQISKQWLSDNRTFKVEKFFVEPESETQLKKRERDGDSTNHTSSSGTRPKWFKRN